MGSIAPIVDCIVITGSMGSGKSATLAEASDLLVAADVAHAAIDLDALGLAHLGRDHDLMLRNLSSVCQNYREAGICRLVIAAAVESRAELDRIQHATAAERVSLCRLTAARSTMEARVPYRSEAVRERKEPSGLFYYWNGERPLHPNAPKLEGTGEIRLESAERATGYWKTHADTDPSVNARTVGVYLRADAEDMTILDGRDNRRRAKLIADRLKHWKAITTT